MVNECVINEKSQFPETQWVRRFGNVRKRPSRRKRFAKMPAAVRLRSLMQRGTTVLELRQYTLHPGQRDVLIELFEREFIESQEALGMEVIGTFRDLDRPDRFVWLRGFPDMAARGERLQSFYGGAVWQKHRDAANATMIDSDNVLLLRAAYPDSRFPIVRGRPPQGTKENPNMMVTATICSLASEVESGFIDFFRNLLEPELEAAGGAVRALYVSETAPNNFPRLPVRENDRVFVWFATFANPAEYDRYTARLDQSKKWRTFAAELKRRLIKEPEVLRLQPTSRSAFPSGASDFDFLIGDWSVAHRRLKRRLANDTEWIEMTGPASVRRILDGFGNFDEITIPLPSQTYIGSTLRLFNPRTADWTIYWMDSRDPKLDPPMIGRFKDGRGLFFGEDTFDGKPIRIRFIWTPIDDKSCRWEQAFSIDGGTSWETNWIMNFTRRSRRRAAPAS
jgi:NIPSNAP